jgi:hypothetical protein
MLCAKVAVGERRVSVFGLRAWRLVGTDGLYAAAVANGLVADDGERQCWATIRSGLGAGLQEPKDLDADDRAARRRRVP